MTELYCRTVGHTVSVCCIDIIEYIPCTYCSAVIHVSEMFISCIASNLRYCTYPLL